MRIVIRVPLKSVMSDQSPRQAERRNRSVHGAHEDSGHRRTQQFGRTGNFLEVAIKQGDFLKTARRQEKRGSREITELLDAVSSLWGETRVHAARSGYPGRYDSAMAEKKEGQSDVIESFEAFS